MYARRLNDSRYSWFNVAHLFMMQARERALLSLMKERLEPLAEKRILEIGCGAGQWLRDFIKWGAAPEHVTGLDLLPDRIEAARCTCPDGVTLVCGSALRTGFPDASFDIVLQSTVFSSMLDDGVRREVAVEMLRVLKPGGSILWYDFHVDNPRNADVRGVSRSEIAALFPASRVVLRRITLAPPIVRALAPRSWLACELLERVPWLCTHYLGSIRRDHD